MPVTSNDEGNDDDGGDSGGNGNYHAGNDGNGHQPDVLVHEEEPNSEFGPYDEDILNESLGIPRHDRCRKRLIKSAKKVIRDKDELLTQARIVEERWQQVLHYEENLKNKSKRKATKQALTKHGWNLIKDLDATTDHNAVSKHTWLKTCIPMQEIGLPAGMAGEPIRPNTLPRCHTLVARILDVRRNWTPASRRNAQSCPRTSLLG